MSNQYKHAYGVGKELKKIFITENNYYYYKGKLVDSFFYGLPSNSLLDTARFCLVRMDNSLDTVGLTYHRNFYVGHACGYRYKLSDVKIFELSRRFQKDSCYVSDSLSYFHAVDDKRLVLAIKS